MKRIIFALMVVLACGVHAEQDGFAWKNVDDKSLSLRENGEPVLAYNYGTVGKEGVSEKYNRANYLHPVYGLDGEVLTEDFPKDHAHHRGVFWAWPHVVVDGQDHESWIPFDFHYKHENWIQRQATSTQAVVAAENGWYAGGKKIMYERVRMTIHPAANGRRAIDFRFTWRPTDRPVTLQGRANPAKSYGGFTFRFNTRFREEDGIDPSKVAITTPDGVTEEDLVNTRLKWADLTAPFRQEGKKSGAAIFIPPSHPDSPPTWLTRHYGCLCVGWPGVDARTLQPGEQVTCSYRVLIHRGQLSTEELQQAYREYVQTRGADAERQSTRIIHREQSRFQKIYVLKQGSVVSLKFGSPRATMTQSEVDLSNLRRHMLEYSRLCLAGLLYQPEPRRILVVGLGGGVIPRELHHYYPKARVDAVEIDPAIPPVARRFFAFPTDPTVRVHVADGREFVEKRARSGAPPYDLIVLDAYGSKGAPFHLMTKEFLEAVREILAPDGAVVSNLIRTHRFFESELKTYLHVFGRYQAYVGTESTNVIVVAPGPQAPVFSPEAARRRAQRIKQARGLQFDIEAAARHLHTHYMPGRNATVLTDAMRPRGRSESGIEILRNPASTRIVCQDDIPRGETDHAGAKPWNTF